MCALPIACVTSVLFCPFYGVTPKGPEYRPHQYTYKADRIAETDTVVANDKCSVPAGACVPDRAAPERLADPEETKPARPARIDGTVLRLSTDELVRLAPRLRSYLTTPTPAWPAIVDAADWLRGD